MAAPVEIRRATDADAAGIASCLDRAFDAYRPHYPDDGYRDSVPDEDSVRRRLRSMTLFVATSSGEIVGTVSCDISAPGVGHLRGMAVLPGWQGQGVASARDPLLRARGLSRVGRVGDFFGMPLFEYVKTI